MRIVRYGDPAHPRVGAVIEQEVFDLPGGLAGPGEPGERVGALGTVPLLAPCAPRSIICAGANYDSQLREKGLRRPAEPRFFLKGLNTLVGPDAEVVHPCDLGLLQYEGELAVVMGRTARQIERRSWRDYVLGYTCANDVTADDWRSDGQWVRAKSSDTFCPLGPWIETDVAEPMDLRLRTYLNGDVVQDGSTGEMIFDIGGLLSYITRWVTLQPGDVVLTGSPGGVGRMAPGDVVTVEIEHVGSLTNTVVLGP